MHEINLFVIELVRSWIVDLFPVGSEIIPISPNLVEEFEEEEIVVVMVVVF